MKNKKIIAPIISFSAASAILSPLMATMVGCSKNNEGWYDLSKFDFKPNSKFDIQETRFSKLGLTNFYVNTILKTQLIFEQDIIWSIQQAVLWRFQQTNEQRLLRQVRKFNIRISDLSLKDETKDAKTPTVRYSFKIEYDIDLSYLIGTSYSSAKNYDLRAKGTMEFKNIPMWIGGPEHDTTDLGLWQLFGSDRRYAIFFSYAFGSQTMQKDDSWSITMNETGLCTEVSDKEMIIKNAVWNNKINSNSNPGISYFSNFLVDWRTVSDTPTGNEHVGSDYAITSIAIISYFLSDVEETYTRNGDWFDIDGSEEGSEGESEGEEEGGEEAEPDYVSGSVSRSRKVLI